MPAEDSSELKIEAEETEIPMLTFYVKEDAMDEPEEISMEELTAYDRNLGIGDQVIIGPDETLFPLDMAENLGMFDEIDPLNQISETDPRQWQMEWMELFFRFTKTTVELKSVVMNLSSKQELY